MNKLISLIRRAPKRIAATVAILAAVVIVPALGHAWGPDRPTYTTANPADHITFNSMTDNPAVGDERNFVVAKDASNTADGGWSDNITVQPGKEYVIRVYAHNNAASSLNLKAINTRVSASVPTTTGTNVTVSGFVSADNAAQKQVWDDVHFNGAQNFNLTYVAGSAQIFNNGYAKNGASLPDSIVTSAGALIGYNGPDGIVPGCFQYANYVYFKVKPQFTSTTDFTMTKKVSKHGANQWNKTYAAQPGEIVDFALVYKNTGQTQQDNVTFRDTLPTGLSYVAGSGAWSNVNTQNVKFTNDANLTNGTGINVGSYLPGGNAYIIFSAKVAAEDQLPCGPSTLTNQAKVNTGGYSVSDTADVTVNRTCTPPPVYKCDLLTNTLVTGTQYKFNGSASASNGATVTGYTLDFGDGTTPFTGATVSNVTHTYAQKDATYTARLTANVTVDGKTVPVTSDACAVKITISIPKIQVCDLTTKKVVTINESDFDAKKYSKNLDDCKTPVQIQVCELATKKIVTIDEKDFDASKYSKNLDDCKTVPPVKITVCDLTTKQVVSIDEKDFDANKYSKNLDDCKPPVTPMCTVPGKENLPANSPDCKETPKCTVPGKENLPANSPDCVTPPVELPHTGIGDGIVTTFGIGSLIASASYYIASRRGLNR